MVTKKTTVAAPTVAKKSNRVAPPAKSAKATKVAKVVKPTKRTAPIRPAETGVVLKELKSLAKELSKAAKGLEGRRGHKGEPKEISTVLGNVERMTAEAATKSLFEAETAQQGVKSVLDSLSKNWSRDEIETTLKDVSAHLTNIVVAQEFQDLAGQSLRQAIKALVGAIIMVEGGGPTEDRRLSQAEIDSMLQNLMA
jgi:chemotaxis regulatin CheY-phosphate phosphatase CheZ